MAIDVEDGPQSFASMEEEFEDACWAAIAECERLKLIPRPTAWIGMIGRHGAAKAARRLVVSGDVQSGFERLIHAGRPDLTVEWAILDPKWHQLFSKQHREAAQWRLIQAKVKLPR